MLMGFEASQYCLLFGCMAGLIIYQEAILVSMFSSSYQAILFRAYYSGKGKVVLIHFGNSTKGE